MRTSRRISTARFLPFVDHIRILFLAQFPYVGVPIRLRWRVTSQDICRCNQNRGQADERSPRTDLRRRRLAILRASMLESKRGQLPSLDGMCRNASRRAWWPFDLAKALPCQLHSACRWTNGVACAASPQRRFCCATWNSHGVTLSNAHATGERNENTAKIAAACTGSEHCFDRNGNRHHAASAKRQAAPERHLVAALRLASRTRLVAVATAPNRARP